MGPLVPDFWSISLPTFGEATVTSITPQPAVLHEVEETIGFTADIVSRLVGYQPGDSSALAEVSGPDQEPRTGLAETA